MVREKIEEKTIGWRRERERERETKTVTECRLEIRKKSRTAIQIPKMSNYIILSLSLSVCYLTLALYNS